MVEIVKNADDTFAFSIKTENGQVLLNSVSFLDEKEAKAMIEKLNISETSLPLFERKTNHDGAFLFSLKNVRGQIIGFSQLYNSEAGMENGIKNLKKCLVELSYQI